MSHETVYQDGAGLAKPKRSKNQETRSRGLSRVQLGGQLTANLCEVIGLCAPRGPVSPQDCRLCGLGLLPNFLLRRASFLLPAYPRGACASKPVLFHRGSRLYLSK